MQTPIYDLELPDTFHRNKRTLLLFASAALLVSLARVSSDLQITTPYVNANIDKVTVWALLWASAAYYAVGFSIDVSSVLRRFSSFVEKHSTVGIDAAIDELARKLAELAVPEARLEQQIAEIEANAGRSASLIGLDVSDDTFERAMINGIQGAAPSTFGPDATHESRMVVTGLIDGLKRLVRTEQQKSSVILLTIDQKLETLRTEMTGLRGQAAEATALLQSTKSEIGKLSPSIIRERRVQLRLWECMAPFVFFIAVTVASAPESLIAVRRAVNLPAAIQSWSSDLRCAWRYDRPECSVALAREIGGSGS